MFTWVGRQFDGLLSTYALNVSSSLMAALLPLALSLMTLWVILFGWAVLRNEVNETVPVFLWKIFKISLVLVIALQGTVYMQTVSESANSLATGLAVSFLPPASDPMTITSPYELLDRFNDGASQLTLDLMRDAGITRLDLVFAAVVVSFGNVIFLCVALFVVTLAKLYLTFTIAVGPLFVLCLAWKPTARFFDNWVTMVVNAGVITWFVFFALGVSAFLGNGILQAIQVGGGLSGPSLNAVGESLKYCIVMILMAIVCFQASSLAAGLTGGAAFQQGMHIVQNAMVLAGLRSASRGGGGAAGAAGGVIRGGAGIPFAAGHAAGSAARYAGSMATAAATAARRAAPSRIPNSVQRPSYFSRPNT